MINKENSLILFRCWQRPNRNPIQTGMVERFSDALHAPQLSPPLPPLRKGGKVGGVWSFSPLAKRGYRGVLRVPLRCARFAIQAIENRSSAVCSRIAYSDHKRLWCSYLLPAGEGAPQGRMRAELRALVRKSPHPAIPARPRKRGSPRSPREQERRPRRACNSTVKRDITLAPKKLIRTRRASEGSALVCARMRNFLAGVISPAIPRKL